MKITILGPAHPYRGGLASIMEIMARTFQRRGDEVDIKTFTLQYPSLLFPGESQTVATPPPADLRICRCVNTMNPLNWVRVGRRIRRERPDFVLMKYWTPFMAPCFGTIARIARGNGHTKVLCQIDNVEPHERHLTDKPFNRYYLHSVDGFVYMSEQVHSELRAYSDAPALFSPHPLFENFGERVERSEACVRLGLDPANRYVLFFGLIRDYKGLDLLLDAWAQLRRAGRTEGRRLIVAGEFYTAREPYLNRIADNGLQDEVLLHDRFIPDDDVKYYFSAADFVVQPYKTATQSGVTQIAYSSACRWSSRKSGDWPRSCPTAGWGMSANPRPKGLPAPSNGCTKGTRFNASGKTASRNAAAFRGRRCAAASRSCTGWWLPENRGRRSFRENCFFGISFVIQAKRPIFAGPNSYSCILWRHNSSI